MTQGFKLTLMWIVASLAALVVAVAPVTAAISDGHFVPIGPDGFYHARRILDAVADPSSFFQFDTHTHVPEGNLITWPWAYDWSMSLLVRLALALHLTSNPMGALIHIPALAFPLAVLLVLSICRTLELPLLHTLLAMLATALFPLNQALYSLGNIDHHYAEHLFVLATLAVTLGWLKKPDSRARAILAGVTFGLATGVHTAEFALQLPLLGTFFILWLRREPLPKCLVAFASALIIAQLVVALPSLPLQRGEFTYYRLSWFQVYVASCTAMAVILMGRLSLTPRAILVLLGVSIVLLVPTVQQVLFASKFFTHGIVGTEDISEARSVFRLWSDMRSLSYVATLYSWLIVLLPATIILCAWRLRRPKNAVEAHFWLTSLAGLALLAAQIRLQYFGSVALYLPWLVAMASWKPADARLPSFAAAGFGALLVAAYLPGLRMHVFAPQIASGDINYAAMRDVYPRLAQACRKRSGVVLADPNDGHYIRFHSDCSVIANNFFVTQQDADKVLEERRLLSLPARVIAKAAPDVRYVFVRNATLFFVDERGQLVLAPGEYPDHPNYPLVRELLGVDPAALPPGYRLIYELRPLPSSPAFARLFALDPAPSPGTP